MYIEAILLYNFHTKKGEQCMKKILIAICSILILVGCSSSASKTMLKTSADEVIRRIQRDDENSFLLVLTTTNCYSCEEYEKVVTQLESEKEFDIYYIDVNKEEQAKLEELKITLGDYITLPMTYYFENGKLKPDNIKSNYIELETYREWLKQLEIF